jgi:murein DD-endopeptidase MepM/ murein hydrolase activator NlpD
MMRGLAIALAVVLTSLPASAHLRSIPATTTIHAVVLPAGSCISSPFGPRILPDHPQAGTFHNGVDLPAPEGTPVRAVAAGKLLRVENGGPGGLEVLIQHDGYVSVYSHLASVAPSLGKGAIAAGDDVGVVGHTGVSFGPHLFFALLENGQAVDPQPFLDLPMCHGATKRQRTPADILAAGEELSPSSEALRVAREQEAEVWKLRAALGAARRCLKQVCRGEASQLPPARHYYLLSDFPAAHHNLRDVKRVSEAGSH